MALTTTGPSNKRKKANKIITDLTNISQNDDESDPEASELDLGTKIKTPKDVMLEELSLLNNKASKMFKMRQERVERFIVTNQNLNLQNLLVSPPPPPPKPPMPKQAVVQQLMDEDAAKEKEKEKQDKEKRKEYVRTYISPWERAMKGNEELTATMKACMPGPIQTHPQLPQYKSFNRTALPYGGMDNASKLLTFELPEINPAPEDQELLPTLQPDINSRPCFNRTPIGWVCSEDILVDLQTIPLDGETDDL
ncbi:myozenin-1-like isoform X2 [Thalassophryne amazonica]|uniref:myozenin-1-like isoform X2 n=1 Tax=Thalassophryne amazonica TaxID=390379 RepID=UPI0014719BA8|nr:myozenin-1-like isoform X2 [Thalassophryne amazonica]